MVDGARDAELRARLVAAVQRLDALGLNRGSTGNVSARGDSDPTGSGSRRPARARATWPPTIWSGWPATAARTARGSRRANGRFTRRSTARGTTLPPSCTCTRRMRPRSHACGAALPAFHYMVAIAGGDDVPCTPYHLFGTDALSQAVAAAFRDRHACLMANHGLVAGGTGLEHAMKVAVEVEALCEAYLKALAVGEPVLLAR